MFFCGQKNHYIIGGLEAFSSFQSDTLQKNCSDKVLLKHQAHLILFFEYPAIL